jgi:hypothetical protein
MESGNKRLIFVGFLRSSASPPSRSASLLPLGFRWVTRHNILNDDFRRDL